jgi:hypothetical protein
VIVYLRFALYELHTDLLRRAFEDEDITVTNQETLHSLSLADDIINPSEMETLSCWRFFDSLLPVREGGHG